MVKNKGEKPSIEDLTTPKNSNVISKKSKVSSNYDRTAPRKAPDEIQDKSITLKVSETEKVDIENSIKDKYGNIPTSTIIRMALKDFGIKF